MDAFITEMSYDFSYSVITKKTVNQVVEDVIENLREVGFGVIGIIDFKDLFEKKGIEFTKEYRLLEVCNPQTAKTVLEKDPTIGLLLPCTIAIYQKEDKNYISLAKPTVLLSHFLDHHLQELGIDVEKKIVKALENSK